MLSFEHKKSIFRSFSQLQEKPISKGRINYVYPESRQRGKILITQLSSSGNGYVNGKYMDGKIIKEKGYQVDPRGWICIKDFSEEQLREVVEIAMMSMSGKEETERAHSDDSGNETEWQEISDQTYFEQLVRSCLYNWLGYGNINAPVWFLGIEEGGAEIWRNKKKTLEESLRIRSTFRLQMDFRHVWEDLYNISLSSFTGPNVWHYMAAFLLQLEGGNVDVQHINDYIFYSKRLGREDSNHFLGEMMPLPKQSKKSIEPYQSIWKSVNDYYNEVANRRLSLIQQTIIQHQNIKLIVLYDQELTKKLLEYFATIEMINSWHFRNESYKLYKVWLENERDVWVLSTPFFGNGRVSYDGIRDAARRVLDVL